MGVPVMAVAAAAGARGTGIEHHAMARARRRSAFGEGRRPESATQVQLPEFEGPLALLLSLIEARQLDILTVPLGALADAYLDALARLDEGRMGNVSSFVTIASQLILIKSRAMLPRRPDPADPTALPDEGPDPEAELRARLILYRAYRDAGTSLAAEAARRVGLFRREPAVARAAALAGARAHGCAEARSGPSRASARSACGDRAAARAAARGVARTITITERADTDPRRPARRTARRPPGPARPGVRDRVVIAVTFLAMLELMKRREIVVEQLEPWGPIVARSTTAGGTGGRRRLRPTRTRRSMRRWSRSRERRPGSWTANRGALPPIVDPKRPGRAADAPRHRADRGGSRGPPVRRRAAAGAARDRDASPAPTARPSTPASATSRSRCGTRASGW